MASSVYETVTNQIIHELEKGVAPWVKPWESGGVADMPYNIISQRHYNGVNVLLLWAAAFERGYRSAAWLTFNQAKEVGAHVRKGEHAVPIVYAKTYTKKGTADTGDDEEERISLLRFYFVFNLPNADGSFVAE